MSEEKKQKSILYIFIAIFIIKGIFYAVYITPPTLGASFDDVGHFSYIQYVASERKLPILFETKLENTSQKVWYTYYRQSGGVVTDLLIQQEEFDEDNDINWIVQHPPLYYIFMVPIYLLCKVFTDQFITILLSIRIATLLFGVASLFVISKVLDILKAKNVVRNCIYISFVFSVPIQFYFSNITNDSLLIFLCILSLYYLLKYLNEKKIIDYYIFVSSCGLIMLTKYSGGLILISYIGYFIYKSIKDDGMKNTVKLCLSGAILGVIIIGPVLLRNFILYGNIFQVYGEHFRTFDFTLYQFFVESIYLSEITRHIIAIIGWRGPIAPTKIHELLVAVIFSTSAVLYCYHTRKKIEKYILYLVSIVIILICHYVVKIEFIYCVIISSCMIIVISNITLWGLSSNNKEIRTFLSISIIIVFIIFAMEQYRVYCTQGQVRATHGRYYYIALFPFLYISFHSLEYIKYSKYLPLGLLTACIISEADTIMQCIVRW